MDGIDILALQETWHHASDDLAIRSSVPAGFSNFDTPRLADCRGGGVAIIFRTALRGRSLLLPFRPTSFESVSAEFYSAGHHVIVTSIYRPGSNPPSCQFFDDITRLFDHLAVYSCPVIIVSDFSIHMELINDPSTAHLASLLEHFDLHQLVTYPTHRAQPNTRLRGRDTDRVINSRPRNLRFSA
jgi:hypothetical protein